MLETVRRYWIAGLVLMLIGLHASIVGLIRYQASLAKIDASCEVDLGSYLAFQSGRNAPISMQLHAIVPINHRMKSRQLIELNQAQIRQSLEEHLRQIDGKLLTDPYLSDLKSQLLEIMVQTIGNSSIDDLLVTRVQEAKDQAVLEFVSRGEPRTPRQLVATLRSNKTEDEEEHGHGEEEAHAEGHAEDDGHAPADSHAAPKKSDSHGSSSHGNSAKSSGSHGSSSKKPAAKSSSHGSEKKPAKKASGH